MKLLDLKEAANLLKMTPEGLRRLAVIKKIPGAKLGKRWCFIEADLVDYVRSLYATPCKASQGVNHEEVKLWHSAREKVSGGYVSLTKDREYRKALGLPIK